MLEPSVPLSLFLSIGKNLVVSMERTLVPTDSKGAYLQSELDSEALYLRDPAESCGLLNANPTSAPTVVGVTEAGSDTGTAATEADRVCSAKDTRGTTDGLQFAGNLTTGGLHQRPNRAVKP